MQVPSSVYEGKGKIHPITGHEGPEVDKRYSSTLSITSALYGVGWSTPHPSHFTPRKDPVQNCIGGRVGPRTGLDGCRKSRPPMGFDPRTFQLIASNYTDCDILAHLPVCIPSKMCCCATYNAAAVMQRCFCCTCLISLVLSYCSLTLCSACYLDFCDIL